MKTIKRLLFLLIASVCALLLSASFSELDIFQIFQSGPPEITQEGILFTYKPEKHQPKYVMVSGDFDNWRTPHMMTKNENGIYVFLFSQIKERGVILKEGRYRYRYLVDGVWIKDPLNPRSIQDHRGTELSYFVLNAPLIRVHFNPVHIEKNSYIFYLKDPEARKVHIVGDFNNWNPYSHPLKRNKSGLWEVEVDIPPGSYAYRFIVDGKFKRDPLGRETVYDSFYNELSLLKIPLEE